MCTELWAVNCSLDYGEMSSFIICVNEQTANAVVLREEGNGSGFLCYKEKLVLDEETGEYR